MKKLTKICKSLNISIDGDKNLILQKLFFFWFKKSSDNGFEPAEKKLAYETFKARYKEIKEIRKQRKTKLTTFEDAELSDVSYNLGTCFQNGFGVQKNEKQAKTLYKVAAHRGHAKAQYELARSEIVSTDNKQLIKECEKYGIYTDDLKDNFNHFIK